MQVSRQMNSVTDRCSFYTVSAEPQCRESCHLPDCLLLPEEIINKRTGRWMTQASIPASSPVNQLRIINHWLGTIRRWILTNHTLVLDQGHLTISINPPYPLLCVTFNMPTNNGLINVELFPVWQQREPAIQSMVTFAFHVFDNLWYSCVCRISFRHSSLWHTILCCWPWGRHIDSADLWRWERTQLMKISQPLMMW